MEDLQIPQEQLKHEFQNICSTLNHKALHQNLIKEDIQSLQGIAERLRSTDHFQDCVRMYIRSRKATVNTIYDQLQKEMNVESVRVFEYWEELNKKIQLWIQIARICIGNIFIQEKCVYEQIFGGLGLSEDVADQGYVQIIGDAAAKLFEILNSLMSRRRLIQKLEILLPVYQELFSLMPIIDSLFPQDSSLTRNIHDHASGIVFQLSEYIKRQISASERHVLRELSIYPTPGGAIHPLTEYVIGYIDLVFNYRKSLYSLIGTLEGSNDLAIQEMDSLETDQFQTSPIKHHLIRIIGFLLYNLRHKCKFYDHKSLGHLFMMNNVHHIAQKIGNSQGLQEIFGYNYLMSLRDRVKEYMTDYLKTTWNVVLYCLRDERSKPQGKWSFLFSKSNRDVKEKFKAFNPLIKNIHLRQEEWEVPDKQLRKKLHQSILNKLIPAYTHFLEHYKSEIDKLRHPEMYIRYSVKGLESKILDMFLFQDLAQTTSKASATNLKQVSAQNPYKTGSSNRWMSNNSGVLASVVC